jgi:STE24 endopeptidase
VSATTILSLFLFARVIQHLIERFLARLNKAYYEEAGRLQEAAAALKIDPKDLDKTLNYSRDKYHFSSWTGGIQLAISLAFIALGGLGWIEQLSMQMAGGPILTGLAFFAILGLLSSLVGLPFEWYYTFHLEEKHGFNRQSKKDFWLDRLKGLVLTVVLGGLLLAALFWIMERSGSTWWLWAWGLLFGFSLLTVWIYPTLLAPIFNKFTPVEEGELKDGIDKLARQVDFKTDGISIMDASRRSSHGNAYFTGVFGKKKIVLFDTLVKSMSVPEIIAVLAHELGHFKLNHIRWGLVRSFFGTGLIFFLIALLMPHEVLYEAFHLHGGCHYGALLVFSLWFGIVGFFLQPLTSVLSRRNEFAADAFALKYIDDKRRLGDALLKLRETSHVMPISHPLFSAVYHSHPPLLERLRAMRYI